MSIEYKSLESIREWDQNKVNSYLVQEGFSLPELSRIRSIDNPLLQLREAGKLFSDLGWHNFSQIQLAMVIVPWETQKRNNMISSILKKMYSKKRDELNEQYNIGTNCMQLLREETGNYYGNLNEARKIWPKFVPGTRDWKNNITLPLTIDKKVAQLLGVIWVDGTFNVQSDATNPDRVTFEGRQTDEKFYSSFILPTVKDIFNYISETKTIVRRGTFPGSSLPEKISEYFTPTIKIHSTAVTSWLSYDLGFSSIYTRIQRDLPDLNWKDDIVASGFLEGVIASRGRVIASSSGMSLEATENDPVFRMAISELLRLNNITHSEIKRGIYIPKGEKSNMAKKYDFINPSHVNRF